MSSSHARATPRFSVVIPAHNAADTIEEQLDAVRLNDAPDLLSVVVVDSHSTDETAAVAARSAATWSKIQVVTAQRTGANAARNTGVANTSAEIVLLCDADDVVTPGWAQAMVDGLDRYDVVRGRCTVEELNDAATIAARGSISATRPPIPDEMYPGLGGNCAFRRAAWEQLGGMSEHYRGVDDADFFWRAWLAGMRVGYVDDAVVQYRLRPSYLTLFRQQKSWASGRAQLFRDFRGTGVMDRRTVIEAVKTWGWVVVHAPRAWSSDPARRGEWLRTCAGSLGRIDGSVRYRVWFP